MITSLLIFGFAGLLSLGLTPLAGKLAKRMNILDHPDEKLKRHHQPIPYLGGLAVYVAFLLALGAFKYWESSSMIGVVGVVTGTSLIVLLGLLDDKYRLSPAAKFAGQIIAAAVLYACHMRLQFMHQPVLSLLLSVIWVVGVTNALNLIDIMDGLCSGVGAIAAAMFFIIAVQNGRANDMFITAALAGALLGFLPHNFPKAKIYLGDTGALLVGFILASVAMGEDYSKTNPLAVISPVLILGVPIFDTLFIMFLRHRRGVSMFRGSPDHLALRMVKLGLNKKQTVLVLWGATLLLGLVAQLAMRLELQWSILLYGGLGMLTLLVAERMGSFPMEKHS